MVDHDRRRRDRAVGQSAKRHLLSRGRTHVDIIKRVRTGLETRIDLKHHVILIERGKHRRDDALAESVVESIVNSRRQNAEARCHLAVHCRIQTRPGVLLIGGDAGNSRNAFELVEKIGRPMIKLVRISIAQSVLILSL